MTGPNAEVLQALEFLAAVREDRTERALALLKEQPGIASRSIRTACAAGNLPAVRDFLATDASLAIETLPPDHTAPIVYAALSDIKREAGVSEAVQAEIVHALLTSGADPNTSVPLPDQQGEIPVLFFPSAAGNVPVVRVLLAHGARPTDGESVYHAAQYDRREVLALLQEFGADLSHAPDGLGSTPLYFLASHRVSNPLAPSVRRGMAWLLEEGADPNVPLRRLADGQHASQLGELAVHRLAANGYGPETLALFANHGAQLDASRDDGSTPYVLAVRSGNAEAARWLADAGADTSRLAATDRLLCACLTDDGDAAREIVTAHPGLVAALTETDAGALLHALADDNITAAELMLSLGWPLTTQSEWGGTALHWAAWNGHPHLVRLLLGHGAPVNVRDTRYGSSPIAWAAHGSLFSGKGTDEEYTTIVQLLLDAGATREESINRWQEPPETMARPAVAALLVERGFAPATG